MSRSITLRKLCTHLRKRAMHLPKSKALLIQLDYSKYTGRRNRVEVVDQVRSTVRKVRNISFVE